MSSSPVPATEVPVLEVSGLTKRFPAPGGRQVIALDGVDLQVLPARVTGLVGPDGAGKTTLMRLAAGLLEPDAGTLRVLGLDAVREGLEIQSRVGYMPQKFGLYEDLTIQENLDLYADLQGVEPGERPERFRLLLDMTGLGPFTRRLAGKLSGGMKQKLGLACCLVKPPGMLLLDEPTVGVDPVSRRELWRIVYRLVEEEGIGVLLTTAYLDEAEQCHHVVVMHRGKKLAEGPPRDFRDPLAGCVDLVSPSPGTRARSWQGRILTAPGVLDATVRSGRVRVVRETRESAPYGHLEGGSGLRVEAAAPNFEDAFMRLLAHHHEEPLTPVGATPDSASGAVPQAPGGDDVLVRAVRLGKRFGDFHAVREVDFEVHRGEIFGLLGPNGAGKTTTFRMLCGLSSPTSGKVEVAGLDLTTAAGEARQRLGYMAQRFSLYGQLSVEENLRFYGSAYGLWGRGLEARLTWALEEFELGERRKQAAAALPGGFKQRLAMAAALLHEPEILFLDEPTSGVDPLARREFWLRINGFADQGVTVVVTTHFMEEAECCDRMLIMSRGQVMASGTPAEIRSLAVGPEHPDPSIEDAFVFLAERQTAEEAA